MSGVRRPIAVALLALACVLLVAACGDSGGSSEGGSPPPASPPVIVLSPSQSDLPIHVAVTLPVFAEFAREVGGENVEVFSLFPAGADPHSYQLTPDDIARIPEADIFFVNGLGLDTEAQRIIEENRKASAKVIAFGPNMTSPRAGELGDINLTAEDADDNLHLWLDPVMARSYVDLIADIYMIADRVNEEFYRANLVAYSQKLIELKDEIAPQISTVPSADRAFVTYHDSFIHFANRFGLRVVATAVTTPGEEPSEESVEQLRESLAVDNQPAVFAEVGFDASALEQVASTAGVEVCRLFSDIQDDSVPTYIGMMQANAAELVRCLGGEGG